MIDEANNLIEVKQNLFNEYQGEYANIWYCNFLQVLESIDI